MVLKFINQGVSPVDFFYLIVDVPEQFFYFLGVQVSK